MSMSIEKALLGRARPYTLAAKAKAIVRQEVSKGCLPDIIAQPVPLEPAYHPVLGGEDHLQRDRAECCVYENPPAEGELVRLQLWISPEQTCEWVRSELLLKQFACAGRRITLEILGNEERIAVQILCHQFDLPILRASFLGQSEQCMLTFTRTDTMKAAVTVTTGGATHPAAPRAGLKLNCQCNLFPDVRCLPGVIQ